MYVMDYQTVNRKRITTNNFTEANAILESQMDLNWCLPTGQNPNGGHTLQSVSGRQRKQSQVELKNSAPYVGQYGLLTIESLFQRPAKRIADAEVRGFSSSEAWVVMDSSAGGHANRKLWCNLIRKCTLHQKISE